MGSHAHTPLAVFSLPPFSLSAILVSPQKTLLLSTTSAILVDIHFFWRTLLVDIHFFGRTLEHNLTRALWRASLHSCTGPILGFALQCILYSFQVLLSCMFCL